MSQRVLSPDQFGSLRGTDPGLKGARIDRVADVLYAREPQFMGQLEEDVRTNGVQWPVRAKDDAAGRVHISEGHHRAAAAFRAGAPLPVASTYRDVSEEGLQSYREHARHWTSVRAEHPEERDARDWLGEPNDPYRKLHRK